MPEEEGNESKAPVERGGSKQADGHAKGDDARSEAGDLGARGRGERAVDADERHAGGEAGEDSGGDERGIVDRKDAGQCSEKGDQGKRARGLREPGRAAGEKSGEEGGEGECGGQGGDARNAGVPEPRFLRSEREDHQQRESVQPEEDGEGAVAGK